MNIWMNSGLQVETEDFRITLDAEVSESSDFGVISHAHSDHLPRRSSTGSYVCSDITSRLCKQRVGELSRESNDSIRMINGGHIPGSKAVVIESGGDSILYTGDFSVRDRLHLNGFEATEADYLIIESTYGHPRYNFENQESLESDIVEWFETVDSAVCKGYSLGRAQEIELLSRRAGKDTVLVNKETWNINSCLEDFGYDFSTNLYNDELPEGSVLITSNSNQFESVSESGLESAVFTGWASDGRYDNLGVTDEAFVLSDHPDFSELLGVVEEVNPERVFTVHGYKERLANEIKRRTGIEATALKNGQRRLDSF